MKVKQNVGKRSKTFVKNKTLKGLGENDRMAQVVALLAQFSEGLEGIKDVLKN